jgi:hypothetical protein
MHIQEIITPTYREKKNKQTKEITTAQLYLYL